MAGSDFSIHSSLRARSDPGGVANRGMSVPLRMAMIEVDGDTGDLQELAKYHTLVHDDETTDTGIIIRSMGGLITEIVDHDTVQGVVTVRTKGTTPANLDTITFNDNAGIGTWNQTDSLTVDRFAFADAVDWTIYHVPAGSGIEVALTTAGTTAGTVAGKMLICLEYFVIPRRVREN